MFRQGANHFLDLATPQTLLLGAAPLLGLSRATAWCRVAQILTDVKEIAQEGGLLAEHLLALKRDPLGSVSQCVNLAIQPPPSLTGTVAPTLASFGYAPKGGPVKRCRTVFGLGRYQSHFLPPPGPFAFPWPWRHGADQRPIGLGNDMFSPYCGQHSKRLRVLGLQFRARPLRMHQRGRTHRAAAQPETIMFQDTLRRPGKGVLDAKVRQHPL